MTERYLDQGLTRPRTVPIFSKCINLQRSLLVHEPRIPRFTLSFILGRLDGGSGIVFITLFTEDFVYFSSRVLEGMFHQWNQSLKCHKIYQGLSFRHTNYVVSPASRVSPTLKDVVSNYYNPPNANNHF